MQQRAQPGYNPDTSHAICGQDADLIMLALALHEPRAVVLREQVWLGKKRGDKYKRFERARFKPLQVQDARCLQPVLVSFPLVLSRVAAHSQVCLRRTRTCCRCSYCT